MFDSSIEYVEVQKLNLDVECDYDLMTGRGIRITSVESFDKKKKKIYNGLQSEFFGTDFGDDDSYQERYACRCKKYIGKMYEGIICDQCGTEVEFNETDLTKTGWVILDHFKVLSPIYWAKLSDALGSSNGDKVLSKILKVDYEEDDPEEKERKNREMKEKDLLELKKHPFIGKGMNWLQENILEVLDYYDKRKPTKHKLFMELKADMDKMFTHSIPIYTSVLRTELPGETNGKSYKLKINTHFRSIIRIVNYVNSIDPEDFTPKNLVNIDMQLEAIQREIEDIFNVEYKTLTSKKGLIMTKIMGGRANFSARNIITSKSGLLRADEIELGYLTFMELFRYEIINLYAKIKECSVEEASNVWKKGLTHFNPALYNIMDWMTKDKESKKYLTVLISRNPCINYGSYLFMRIVAVKPDENDKTMTIPSSICNVSNADFDGDVLNIFRIFGDYFAEEFGRCLNPRFNHYISRMDGHVNKGALPFKDEIIGFYTFNNV